MHYETIRADRQGRVGILTLNRPEKLNAWSAAMTAETIACLDAWADDPAIGAIVLTGAGRAFCAGADFAELAQGDDDTVPTRWVEAVRRTKPIVVAYNGFAVGMGLSVTLPCAVRIASTSARMSMRFVRVGLVPEGASTTLLPAIVGLGWANELCLTGRFVSADEALAMGLVNRLYAPDELLPAAVALATEIADGPTRVAMLIERALQDHRHLPWDTAIERETAAIVEARRGPDHEEAVSAFLAKREPRFNQ